MPNASGTIHYAAAYLPNSLDFLTDKYGDEAVEPLLIPTGGAVRFSLTKNNRFDFLNLKRGMLAVRVAFLALTNSN